MENKFGKRVHLAFRLYCALIFAIGFLYLIYCIYDYQNYNFKDADEANQMFYVVIGFLSFLFLSCLPYLIGIFLPRRDKTWTFGLVVILLGLLGCYSTLPSIIMLIYWSKAETKEYFGYRK